MRKVLGIALLKIAGLFRRLARKIYVPLPEKRAAKWFRDHGDKQLRLNYDLNAESIVFDLGGFEGQWTSDIFGKYCCAIHVFEAVPEFAKNIQERFSRNNNIIVHAAGLASENTSLEISFNSDQSSVYKSTKSKEKKIVKMVSYSSFVKEYGITKIDLMKINIEGGEYALLEHLIEAGRVMEIKNIQVQFHDFVPNAIERMLKIQDNLRQTHHLTYQYEFVWENWSINA